MRRFLLLCLSSLLLLLLMGCGAQSSLRKADQFYALGEYSEAAVWYKKAYSQTKPKDKVLRGERAFMMGQCYRRINNNSRALGAYQNAVRFGCADSSAILYLAGLQLMKGDYKNAAANYQRFLTLNPASVLAQNGLKSCELAPLWKANPTRYTVKKEALFNSRRSEFSPMFGGEDCSELYITSTRDKASGEDRSLITGVKAPDIFCATRNEKGAWKSPEVIEGGLNTEYEEGTCCFTPDHRTMYLTQCTMDASSARPAQICTSTRSDAAWGAPKVCSFIVDSVSSYAHPAVSPDGAWLYFTSDLGMDAMGGYDLYRVAITSDGYGGMENLGPAINTPGDELFPTFRPNGDLYFSSNGHPGMGGLDIFCAHEEDDGQWTVTNLQYPVNSPQDDFGMTFEGVYTRGFFSSNRGDARGLDHIWSFYMPETVHTLTGWLYEKDGYELPQGMVYIIGNDGTNDKIDLHTDGSFTRRLTPGVSYVLLGTCRGFLNYKQELTADSTIEDRSYELLFPLSSITRPVLIDNIFYEFNKATLTPESTTALDQLVTLLNDNPNVTIELSAHCDYKGREAYNERLSQRRAESVVNYLVEHGIDAERLTPRGYGESQPVTVRRRMAERYPFLQENNVLTEAFILSLPEEQQEICNQLNRRTQFRVLRTTWHLFE